VPVTFDEFASVRSRQELTGKATEYMLALFEQVSAGQRQAYEAGLFKTYFVECNVVDGDGVGRALKAIASVANVSIRPTREEGFFVALYETQRAQDVYFIDATHPRFWLIHTPTVTGRADRIFQRAIYGLPSLDSAWMPTDMLESIASASDAHIGVGTHFSDELFERDPEKRTYFGMRIWGSVAPEVATILRRDALLRRYLAISSIRVKSYFSDVLTVNDTVYFSGKVTANGNSFTAHLEVVNDIFRERYRNAIESTLERTASVRVGPAGRFDAMPLYLDYSQAPVDDVGERLGPLLQGNQPLRFFGVPEDLGSDRYRALVSDLHLAGRFSITLMKEGAQIYVGDGLCGNAIARWTSLFQQSVNATARLRGRADESVFA
jgi:hypothetical protein